MGSIGLSNKADFAMRKQEKERTAAVRLSIQSVSSQRVCDNIELGGSWEKSVADLLILMASDVFEGDVIRKFAEFGENLHV